MESIVDGDTLDVRLGDGTSEAVRLIGVNAPESGECFYAEATGTLAALVPVGSEIGLSADVSDRDQYGRLLRYVWTGDTSVNAELVRRGAALARRYPPDVALADELEDAQADAEVAGRGLWAPDACGAPTDARLTIADIQYDPPGDDDPVEEWVRIRNDGHEAVDMGGWALKDESARHRYSFPPSFVLPAGGTVAVRTGCGRDTATDLHWCEQGSTVWNNDGDTVFLLDPSGNTHATLSYGE